ncbi:APC family permease [Bacillus inaquosorum]|uniref:APC family permease n=1 Tax=Bacillus inaquosorum TaxID=483913 RepID=UPI002E00B1DF|nr:APC family permease [Bacillus inaquosorum]MED1170733.1 APC family permease [Bacillus inaquosorum]MED1197018.1 APC family permease [Bacillus inaquosorum]MED1226029.1 APC family permease [Bacillus inaquosorum]MED1543134.1 APC family permease [Bacillus inaquosorum]
MNGKFKREISLLDLFLIGLGAIFGSAWLFAVSNVASMAGPAGWISWLIAGLIILVLGIVYAELGSSLPRAGGIIRYPVYSHGPLVGYMISFITIIAYTSLIALEVVAVRQYATFWWPSLTIEGSDSPTLFGWFVQFILLAAFFFLNYRGIKAFVKFNTLLSFVKYIVPILIIVILFMHFNEANFTIHGFAPFGTYGIQSAISAGGVIFAYLGLHPIVAAASEVKNPKKTIPVALILTIIVSTVIYLLLQLSFIGSIPTNMLTNGWGDIHQEFSLPFKDIAIILGLGWLANLVALDAIISPGGNGNIYMSTTSRLMYAWAKNRTFFKKFASINNKTGVPQASLFLTFIMSVFWTLPFPSWNTLVNVCSVALILSYAIAPVSAGALRKNAKHVERPYRVRGMKMVAPLAFIFAAFIVYWAGWQTVSWILGVQFLMFLFYCLSKKRVPVQDVTFKQQLKSVWWMLAFYLGMMIVSYLGSFGGIGFLKNPFDLISVGVIALLAFIWSQYTALPKAIIDYDEVEEEMNSDQINISARDRKIGS